MDQRTNQQLQKIYNAIYANGKESFFSRFVDGKDLSEVDNRVLQAMDWQMIFNGKGIFIDVKSIYDKDFYSGTNISHWKL